MKIKYKFLSITITILIIGGVLLNTFIAYAAETYDMVLHGEGHALDEFPLTYYDAVRDITFYRDDNTYRVVIRNTASLYYTEKDNTLRNPDEITLTEYYPATIPLDYTDLLTGEEFTHDTPATRYWWTDLAPAELELKHWGTFHQKNNDNMGWMSNNQINYYPTEEITARFSQTPYAPLNINLYLPDTSYPDYDYDITDIDWSGLVQDAHKEPNYSRLIQLYGHDDGINFISDTEHENRYRKPLYILFKATITLGYPNVEYTADAPLHDTIVTYTDTP